MRFLKTCKWYCESKPKKGFLTKEKSRLKRLIKSINEGFALWSGYNSVSKYYDEKLAAYHKETELTKHQKQLNAIEYILS